MNYFKMFVAFLLMLTISSCENEKSDFLTDQESKSIKDISNVTIYDSENDKVITTEYLKKKWEESLRSEGYNVSLENFEILESFDEELNTKTFFLRTTSKGKTLQTGAFITKTENGQFRLGGKQCTCVGCPNGCEVKISGTSCSCSPCNEDSNKKCTKTESVIIEE